jgi:hypothetical protein
MAKETDHEIKEKYRPRGDVKAHEMHAHNAYALTKKTP